MLEGPYRSSRWRKHLLSIEGVLQILMIPIGLIYLSISAYEAWINGRYVTYPLGTYTIGADLPLADSV